MSRHALLLPLLLLLLPAAVVRAQEEGEALWLRDVAIAPGGDRVAFCYQGDVFVVDAEGGEARPVTVHAAYDTHPVWTPDGERIVFASDRHGDLDLFVAPATGGRARRLTWHSSDDVPSDVTPDGQHVIFSSRRQDAAAACVASPWMPELWAVPLEGGQPVLWITTPAERARVAPDGRRVAYQDLKGYEDEWRKHHVSAVARDLWIHDRETGAHEQVTTFRGEDRDPAWLPDGGLAWLSERGGSFEVWRRGAAGGEPERLTDHGPHPVRFLSAARDGTLAYAYDGALYLRPLDGAPRRVPVTVRLGDRVNDVARETIRKGATEIAPSPNGDEIAFCLRGDVFVASIEHGTTRRVTATPGEERSLHWGPEGRRLLYAAERDGSWGLHLTRIVSEDEEHLFHAAEIAEEAVLVTEEETFQPRFSPDGKQIAFLRERDTLAVLDVDSGEQRDLVGAEHNYSYADGDIDFRWSPDGRWIACTMLEDGGWIDGIGVVEVATGELHNVTRSGYYEWGPRWSGDGDLLVFGSNRHGRRSHGSWGSDADVMGIDLTRAAHDEATMPLEDWELLQKEREEQEKKEKERSRRQRSPDGEEADEDADEGEGEPPGDDDDGDEADEEEKPEPVEIEFEGLDHRTRRLTLHAEQLGAYEPVEDGEALVYVARVGTSWALHGLGLRKEELQRLADLGPGEPRQLAIGHDGEHAFVLKGDGTIVKVRLGRLAAEPGGGGRGRGEGGPGGGGGGPGGGPRGGGGVEPVAWAAEMTIDRPALRRAIFDHVWRQAQRKFYDPALHGVDWAAMREDYARFLPHVETNHDLAELLSEMLGELNASHTGCRHRPDPEDEDETASLGLLFELAEPGGDGLVVAEVLRDGPADRADSRLAPGVRVMAIDGEALVPATSFWRLLDHKAGKRVRLDCRDAQGEAFREVLRPISLREEGNLLYERWVRGREQAALEASDGRCGYVHVRGMNDASFRTVFREVLGKHGDREALVLDTRHNGGGWLHDDLVTFLMGEPYAWFVPRGKARGDLGTEPRFRWSRPVAVLQNEGNYSDAHFFPYAFKTLDIGPLVGAPVAGTATAVWWERQIDPTLIFGIPQVGIQTEDGRYLENLELMPDVEVYNPPEEVARGVDRQLLEAVRVALEQADAEAEGR